MSREVEISAGGRRLRGTLTLPAAARGVVLFAHGSGSSRHSPRNRRVAEALVRAGLGTLLFDLLTQEEEAAEAYSRHLRFDIPISARAPELQRRWPPPRALGNRSAPSCLDTQVLALNEQALTRLRCEKELLIVPEASHLFEEPGTLDQVAALAADWFTRHLGEPAGA